MCVYVYVCMLCVYVFIYVCMYVWTFVCMYVCTLHKFALGAGISADVHYDCTSTSRFSLMFTQFNSCKCEDRQST